MEFSCVHSSDIFRDYRATRTNSTDFTLQITQEDNHIVRLLHTKNVWK
jgi:hypothetical protein